jgi:heterogeneous nuclear ribonucleoprotein A1/A3
MDNTRLREVFSEYGAVADAKIILDPATGKSRGFGFVTFAEQAGAEKALVLDGQEIDGRRVRIDRAQERPRGPGGFSGPRGPAPSDRPSGPPTRSGFSERSPRDSSPRGPGGPGGSVGPRDLGPSSGPRPGPGYGPPPGERSAGPGPGDRSPSRGQARGDRGGRGGAGGGGDRERGGRDGGGRDRKNEDDAAAAKLAGRGGRRRIDDYDFE